MDYGDMRPPPFQDKAILEKRNKKDKNAYNQKIILHSMGKSVNLPDLIKKKS